MKFRIRFADQVVGLFIILAISGFAFALILTGMNQRWFSEDYTYKSRFQTAEGINTGMSIQFKGFKIGKIANISLNEGNKVEVDFVIFEEYLDKVHPNSVLELISNPLGLGGGLVFHPGKNKATILEENSFIPSLSIPEGRRLVKSNLVDMPEKEDPINAILGDVSPLLSQTEKTLVSLDNLLKTVNATLDGTHEGPVSSILADVSGTTANLETIITDISTKTENLLTNLNAISMHIEKLTRNPTGLIPKLLDPKGSLATLLDDDDILFHEIFQILQGVNSTVSEINDFSQYLNGTKPEVSGIITNTKATLETGQKVLEGVKNNPLIRGGIPEQKTQDTTIHSYRDEDF